jgi:DnaK suppressor protein
MLDADQMIELEIRAREELERLEEEAARPGASGQPVAPDNAIGRISRMDSIQVEEMLRDAGRRRDQQIYQLREALRRMDEGTYGNCQACGQGIAYVRLEASPAAERCQKCL